MQCGGVEGARSREAPCESGYRCHLPGVRHACAPGTHEPAAGVEVTQVDAAQCRPCPPGHYCPQATAPRNRAAGTYGNVIGNDYWTHRRRLLGPVLPWPLLHGRLRAADSVSGWNVWEPDRTHDGGVLGGLLPGLDGRNAQPFAMRGEGYYRRRFDAREGA